MRFYTYLFLAIFFNTVLALTYKMSSRGQYVTQRILAIAYCVSFIAAAGSLFIQGHNSLNTRSVIIGLVAGIMVFLSGISFMRAMSYGKLSLSWTVRTLAVAIPIAAAIIFWHEEFSWKHVIGFGLLALCIILIGSDKDK
jgi:uncharacterized membrane protein